MISQKIYIEMWKNYISTLVPQSMHTFSEQSIPYDGVCLSPLC